MIYPVDDSNLESAAKVHSISWKDSHLSFCSPAFLERHTPQRQGEYIRSKIDSGARFFLLMEAEAIGVVSVTENLIEDLYVLPEYQGRGYGTQLLRFAMAACTGRPSLWVLESNAGARRLYEREGFCLTGKKKALSGKIAEIELAWNAEGAGL